MAKDVRLQKMLADCGVASRRKAEELIAAGKVQVNGQTAHIGDKVDPAHDYVAVEGRPVRLWLWPLPTGRCVQLWNILRRICRSVKRMENWMCPAF